MDGSHGGGGSFQLNVLGSPLATCSLQPLTGYFRTGCCETAADDFGADRLAGEGAEVVASTPEQFSAFLKTETAKFERIIREARIRATD